MDEASELSTKALSDASGNNYPQTQHIKTIKMKEQESEEKTDLEWLRAIF